MTAPRGLATATALLVCELACLFLVARLWPLPALGLHVVACIAALALAWQPSRTPTAALATLRMTALLLPFLGPVAALAGLTILAVQCGRGDATTNAAIWHEHLFPNLAADALTERTEAISRRRPGANALEEIESFHDVLRWGSLSEQEHVLSLVSRSFRPEFAPVLRAGLAVADLGLRAQAAAGLSLLETRISAQLGHLQITHQRTGTETSAIHLAQALSDAAHSGLYDEARSEEMRHEIVSLLQPLGRTGGAASGAMLGRTLIQLGAYDQAVETLQAALVTGQHGEAALAWLLEGLFRQGHYPQLGQQLAQHAARVRTIVRQDGPLAPALQFWSEAA